MRYVTTRNAEREYDFATVLLAGVPSQRGEGLFVPKTVPRVSEETLDAWSRLSFRDLTVAVARLFIAESELPGGALEAIVADAFAVFPSADVVELRRLPKHDGLVVAELFNGPSLAFKDIAMFVSARLLNEFLKQRGEKACVLVSTSGDTGPSCLMALEGLSNTGCVVCFPSGRVSSQQAAQMRHRPPAPNARVIEVTHATSDSIDVDAFALFEDATFKSTHGLCSLNSVNWSRVLFQIPHFFWCVFRGRELLGRSIETLAVPTGAMGNSVAGVIAIKMGLPLPRLLLCQNSNDAVVRFLEDLTVQFNARVVHPTIAPAIDIMAPYNIERLLWAVCSESPDQSSRIRSWMESIESNSGPVRISLADDELAWLSAKVQGRRCDEDDILKVIAEILRDDGYLLDPHTSVAVNGALTHVQPCVVLATAHPAKFPEVYTERLGMSEDQRDHVLGVPERLSALKGFSQTQLVVPQNQLSGCLRRVVEEVSTALGR